LDENSEIARYWAAKELTEIKFQKSEIDLFAPYKCQDFTLMFQFTNIQNIKIKVKEKMIDLQRIKSISELSSNKWFYDGKTTKICFNLPKGRSKVKISSA
jgi:hypothetical protein